MWFTPQSVGRIDPVRDLGIDDVTLFQIDGGPLNIAKITPSGVIIRQSKIVKGSEPFGITVAPNGNPWFTM